MGHDDPISRLGHDDYLLVPYCKTQVDFDYYLILN